MLTVDENKRVVISLKLFWGIVVFLCICTFYVTAQLVSLNTNDVAQTGELRDHDSRLKSLETTQAQIATNTAVINTKLDTIQRDISDIKAAQDRAAGD